MSTGTGLNSRSSIQSSSSTPSTAAGRNATLLLMRL